MKRRLLHTLVIAAGFVLSPLSWWNDMVVNLPLSYLMAWPFSLFKEELFPYVFVLGPVNTNPIGSAGTIFLSSKAE